MSSTENSLTAQLSGKTRYKNFRVWVVGDTPLITHAWSEKAKRQMLQSQVKAPKAGKEARDPEADFVSSLYPLTPNMQTEFSVKDGTFGFPATGIKNCIVSSAHKDKGIPRVAVMSALWINATMVRVMPALAGAICDMPLIRIWGSQPEMREDMVKIGSGMVKKANLAYRAQFTIWAFKITGRFNPTVINEEALAFLIQDAGFASGLGEWRNERKGMFGAFHLADAEEETAWDAFATGAGDLPIPSSYREAA